MRTAAASSSAGGPRGRPRPTDLWIARGLTLGSVAIAFPAAAAAVFGFGADRDATADVLSVVYSFGIFAGLTTSFWPLPSLRRWSRIERIESACILFVIVSCVTHLTWEFAWLCLHDAIAAGRDAPWAYPWWAYIDGGDLRYARATPVLLVMEALSVTNGTIGAIGLFLWVRSGHRDDRAVFLFMAMAVVHLYSATLYYGGEIVGGMVSVDTTSFLDTWIKFGLANAPWIVFPWLVLYWGRRTLVRLLSAPQAR